MKYTDWLTKQQAAERIGVSIKTIERLAAARKLHQQMRPQPGTTEIAVYHPGDVDRIAEERRVAARPFVMPPDAMVSTLLPPPGSTPPALRQPQDVTVRDAASFSPEDLVEALRSPQNLEHRDTLNLQEAVRLKGYSVEYFELLNSRGELPFYKIPGRRGRHVRRRDLDQLTCLDLPPWQSRKQAPHS